MALDTYTSVVPSSFFGKLENNFGFHWKQSGSRILNDRATIGDKPGLSITPSQQSDPSIADIMRHIISNKAIQTLHTYSSMKLLTVPELCSSSLKFHLSNTWVRFDFMPIVNRLHLSARFFCC